MSVAPSICLRIHARTMSLFNTKLNPRMLSLLDNDDETYYEGLSPEKRLELDNLRSRAILHHLRRFTLARITAPFATILHRHDAAVSLLFVSHSINMLKLIVIEKG